VVIARRRERLALPICNIAGCTTSSAASPAEPAITPDAIVWYILVSLHRQQRSLTTLLCQLHRPSAALPAGPDVIVWYILAHRRQRLPTVLLCRLHKPSATLPAGPTPDMLVWYLHASSQRRQHFQSTLLYSVCISAAASPAAQYFCPQTVN